MTDPFGELSPDDLDCLMALDAETYHPQPRRKRQTYAPRYRAMFKAYDRTVRAYAAGAGYSLAAGQARSEAIRRGDIDFPTSPTPERVDWWRRKIIRDRKVMIAMMLVEFHEARGIDPAERRRAQKRNSKLRKSAERYQNGDRSKGYDTRRKLMSPEEKAAHDRQKRAAAQRERRAKARQQGSAE